MLFFRCIHDALSESLSLIILLLSCNYITSYIMVFKGLGVFDNTGADTASLRYSLSSLPGLLRHRLRPLFWSQYWSKSSVSQSLTETSLWYSGNFPQQGSPNATTYHHQNSPISWFPFILDRLMKRWDRLLTFCSFVTRCLTVVLAKSVCFQPRQKVTSESNLWRCVLPPRGMS